MTETRGGVMKKIVITYGTFDLFHIGHLNLLRRLKACGDYLIVAVSTDEFNAQKGKQTVVPFEHRLEIVNQIKYVDQVIAEHHWEQKRDDIIRLGASVFGMGHDWEGKFDELKECCEVIYLPRTEAISSELLKHTLRTDAYAAFETCPK